MKRARAPFRRGASRGAGPIVSRKKREKEISLQKKFYITVLSRVRSRLDGILRAPRLAYFARRRTQIKRNRDNANREKNQIA